MLFPEIEQLAHKTMSCHLQRSIFRRYVSLRECSRRRCSKKVRMSMHDVPRSLVGICGIFFVFLATGCKSYATPEPKKYFQVLDIANKVWFYMLSPVTSSEILLRQETNLHGSVENVSCASFLNSILVHRNLQKLSLSQLVVSNKLLFTLICGEVIYFHSRYFSSSLSYY